MDPQNRNSLIAAAIIMVVFGLGAFFMPTLMVALGQESPIAAGLLAVLFVAAFFGVFWLRSRSKKDD